MAPPASAALLWAVTRRVKRNRALAFRQDAVPIVNLDDLAKVMLVFAVIRAHAHHVVQRLSHGRNPFESQYCVSLSTALR
jgi:hypothetical protein